MFFGKMVFEYLGVVYEFVFVELRVCFGLSVLFMCFKIIVYVIILVYCFL